MKWICALIAPIKSSSIINDGLRSGEIQSSARGAARDREWPAVWLLAKYHSNESTEVQTLGVIRIQL